MKLQIFLEIEKTYAAFISCMSCSSTTPSPIGLVSVNIENSGVVESNYGYVPKYIII